MMQKLMMSAGGQEKGRLSPGGGAMAPGADMLRNQDDLLVIKSYDAPGPKISIRSHNVDYEADEEQKQGRD